MGTFNELSIGGDRPRKIQFKHGLCWQLTYEIGDTISWEGRNLIRPASANGGVVVSGISSADYKDAPFEYYAITLVNDRILSATGISEEEFNVLDRIQASSPRVSHVKARKMNDAVPGISRKLIDECVATGQFPFNSQRLASVGEWGLAFDGLYRFVEGNEAFKKSLGRDYKWLKGCFAALSNFDHLPIYDWEPSSKPLSP